MNGWDRVIAAVIARRSDLGLTQKGLADKAGVAERTVQNLEAGKRPQPLIRGKIERALGWPSGEMTRIAERGPDSTIPAEVLAVIRRNYSPKRQREAIEALEAIEREQRGEELPPPEQQHAG